MLPTFLFYLLIGPWVCMYPRVLVSAVSTNFLASLDLSINQLNFIVAATYNSFVSFAFPFTAQLFLLCIILRIPLYRDNKCLPWILLACPLDMLQSNNPYWASFISIPWTNKMCLFFLCLLNRRVTWFPAQAVDFVLPHDWNDKFLYWPFTSSKTFTVFVTLFIYCLYVEQYVHICWDIHILMSIMYVFNVFIYVSELILSFLLSVQLVLDEWGLD